MRIEVVIEKDDRLAFNSYRFYCDKVIDETGSHGSGSLEQDRKLVIMKNVTKVEHENSGGCTKRDVLETIAVFNHWSFWRVIPDDKKDEGPVEIDEERKTVMMVLQTPEGENSAVQYLPSMDIFLLHLRGGYKTTISGEFIEDYLTIPKRKQKHKICESCGKEIITEPIGHKYGKALCQECINKSK